MKKLIIPISTLLLMSTIKAQVQLPSGLASTTTENYIYTRTYLEAKTQSDASARQIQSVQFFDGLGRVKQVVGIKASPSGKDVVTPIVYDSFGRHTRDYLPVPQSGSQNGSIYPQNSSLVDFPVNDAAGMYTGEKAFSEKILENSPLDRIQQQVQVGNAWSNQPAKFDYDANLSNEVYQYITTTTWDGGATKSQLSLSSATVYAPGQLYKNTITDEDGNKTIEFKNGQGQLILVRKVSETVEIDTYYVYNEYNQLAFVLPPNAIHKPVTEDLLNSLCYQYRYDGKGRLVEKKLPGKGWEYMTYDKADRLIMTQDANMRASGKWMFNKYDKYSRVIFSGIANIGAQFTRQQVQNSIYQHIDNGRPATEERSSTGFNFEGMTINYTNSGYPGENIEKVYTINYYDTYPSGSPVFANTFSQPTLGDDISQTFSTKSLPTATYIKNIENDSWTKNYSYYDTKGRSIGSYSVNHLGGHTYVESQLDFSGVAKTTITKHSRLAMDPEVTIKETFDYDDQNRLLVHTHQVGSNPVEFLTQNKYNELSQLENKKVGGIAAAAPLQQMDFKYNIRGWMTKINDPANLNGKLFGYEVKYTSPVYSNVSSGRFNGNITEVDWRTSRDNILKRYNYKYDKLSRLTEGIYSEPDTSVPQNNYYNESTTYDLNGNIASLKRYRNAANVGAELIDNLSYVYTGNRLDTVTDSSLNHFGYPDTSGSLIHYDNNGNMTDHDDKRISEIAYNPLNLPNRIKKKTTIADRFGNYLMENISYLYRADGAKLHKDYSYFSGRNNNSVTTMTDYLDGFQYTGESSGIIFDPAPPTSVLQFVPTTEGYFDFVQNKYIYQYKDHLGNIRLAFYQGINNNAVVDRTNDYYPFGLTFGDNGVNIFGSLSPNYSYAYNGKEYQAETKMYDYGARMYMPELGRWGTVDPLAEKMTRYSPYNYVFNNPIRFIDPDGRRGTDWVGKTDVNGSTTWQWRADITNASDAAKNGFDSYSDGVTNNKYTSKSGSEVTLGTEGKWSEDFTDVNRARLGEAINNCNACKQLESVEKALFIGVPIAIATGGLGGFAVSGEMTASAVSARFLTDASVQAAANFNTNGGNLGSAIKNVNLTQSALAGAGVSYIGNAVVSTAINVNAADTKSVFTGGVSLGTYATQASLSIAGGAAVNGITSSPVFKSIVVGSYMSTTSTLGQTAGTAVANVLMNTPDYTRATLQNRVP
ncbi:RHS repeat-associated core domain-containing protein [Chryseobacterium sp. Tr-659]|uniref:DUF6443 domain-containing protein n=1 Tax=Chryseobacterium sp. Tr-659 TaxID=2608340 RepID=UPI00141FBEBF|nr:DUF6443 domain-containing protein [Chryseobacterium sp. Tr-659]NIF05917.1 RHS repeat-associated core domain-containing protein [Chryseobacterium sp. Tr-659]